MISRNFKHLCLVVSFWFVNVPFTTGEPVVLSAEQKLAVEKLRFALGNKLTAPHMKSDAYLIKYLKAKRFNDDEAREALEKTLKWRKEADINNLPHYKFSPELIKNYVIEQTLKDKKGGPVTLIPFGDWDLRRKVAQGKLFSELSHRIEFFEENAAQLAFNLTGDPTSIALVDLNGFSLRKSGCAGCIPFYVRWVTHHEFHFPYNFYRLIAINTPAVFNPVLNIMRRFMTESTRESLLVFGFDRGEWAAEVGKAIDLDILPFRFGGTKKKKPLLLK